jgi:hypothetical protein
MIIANLGRVIAYRLHDGRYKTAYLRERENDLPNSTVELKVSQSLNNEPEIVTTLDWFHIRMPRPQPFPISETQAKRLRYGQEKGAPARPTIQKPVQPTTPITPVKPVPPPEIFQRKEDTNEPHINIAKLRIPKAIADQYDRLTNTDGSLVSPQAMRFFLRTLWQHVNRQCFDNKLQRIDFDYLRSSDISRMKKRAHWAPHKRKIEIHPKVFGASFPVFVELFVHELCHQAVTDINGPEVDAAEWKVAKGHGPVWKAWMVKCGLNPSRYDQNGNWKYSSDSNDSKTSILQQRYANKFRSEGLINSSTPIKDEDTRVGEEYLRITVLTKTGQHALHRIKVTSIVENGDDSVINFSLPGAAGNYYDPYPLPPMIKYYQ